MHLPRARTRVHKPKRRTSVGLSQCHGEKAMILYPFFRQQRICLALTSVVFSYVLFLYLISEEYGRMREGDVWNCSLQLLKLLGLSNVLKPTQAWNQPRKAGKF